MTAGIGHNQGPSLERGHRWRAYQWRKAQKATMPNTIPLTLVRMRVRRAAELGMDYKTYASIRQASGRDVLGLLFSSNALRIFAGDATMPSDRGARVSGIRNADRMALVQPPLDPEVVARANSFLDTVARAPGFADTWSAMRRQVSDLVVERRLTGAEVVVVGDTALEAEWAPALRAAAYLSADRYFLT